MARRRKNRSRTTQRDIIKQPIASRRLLSPVRNKKQLLLDNARIYSRDNRLFDPLPKMMRPPRLSSGRISLTNIRQQKTIPKSKPLMAITEAFNIPKKTLVCVRRGVRKEVIHALKLTSKGAGASRRRKSQFTNVRC